MDDGGNCYLKGQAFTSKKKKKRHFMICSNADALITPRSISWEDIMMQEIM